MCTHHMPSDYVHSLLSPKMKDCHLPRKINNQRLCTRVTFYYIIAYIFNFRSCKQIDATRIFPPDSVSDVLVSAVSESDVSLVLLL